MNPPTQVNAMLHAAPRKNGTARQLSAVGTATICVVDPQAEDYLGWDATAEANGARFQIVASAAEALRFARTNRVDLWVVNAELPCLSGYELCGMLKSQLASATVLLVADEYSEAAERRAWSQRATMFCCRATLDQHLRTVVAALRHSTHRATF